MQYQMKAILVLVHVYDFCELWVVQNVQNFNLDFLGTLGVNN